MIFRRFSLNLGVFHASAEGASEKFRVFYRGTAYDVIIFKFQGGAFAPPAPPADAHGPYVSPRHSATSSRFRAKTKTGVENIDLTSTTDRVDFVLCRD